MGGASSSSESASSNSGASSSGSLMIGDLCTQASQCLSGACEDGICCTQACNTPCTKCDIKGTVGTCAPVPAGTDDCDVQGELCNDGGQCACGVSKPPTGSTCPVPWVAGPLPGSCLRKCDLVEECKDSMIDCPEGFDCIVECSGHSSCRGNTAIQCPSDQSCTVQCIGQDSCKVNTKVQCGKGPCQIECSNVTGSCDGATLECGDNACVATCAGTSKPAVIAGNSCSAQGC